MKIIRYILLPIVPIYYVITWFRNKLYDFGLKTSTSYNLPIICVGNLSVGGTGKTPMIEYLISILKHDFTVATLSRGYKRKTQGFVLADDTSNAETIGDEPFQFFSKFKNDVLVAVDANRNNGIKNLLQQKPKPKLILLDDAFQHRKVKAGFNILLTTYANPYFNDIVLPTGNLREPKSGAKRANIIIVTKCPDNLTEATKQHYLNKIKPKPYQKVFFSGINYANEVYTNTSSRALDSFKQFTLVTGIANAKPLVDFLNKKGMNFKHLNFKDHYDFTNADVENLNNESIIITTEKDFMRLKQYTILKDKLFYLPITVALNDAITFNSLITNYIKKQ
ncbi:tetraacyldisaccharide 4'-kinase [Seonamhaeicola algicola]|uniref:Tetraacyldisaccharide 4'-kinase n=1 Tax=Seonamhaeicola algicola TaxID=1719036 RepID=A0A5C7AGM5_9FLAO|nr:tetraacyldisaccharide 4'-kinase [Seonamhaeicola algicola]TXE07144.1 tetraacyldisaccharide 4'-kinase [Seonamhaeicola algicola]